MSEQMIVAVEPDEFRQAMSRFASGVTVVTTEHDGQLYGLTVSAFSSLSLRPPLVLICIEKSVRAHAAIAKAERFAVNVLTAAQQEISSRFASRSDDKFSGIPWHEGSLRVPLLDGTLAAIECRLHETLPGGDHTIYVGEVVNTELREGAPLLYFRSQYREAK